MDKESSIDITSKMITELVKEMHSEISNFSRSIKNQVNSYSNDRESYEKFKLTHEGPLFAEVNTKMFELLKEVKTIRKLKEQILSEEPDVPFHEAPTSPISRKMSPYPSRNKIVYVENNEKRGGDATLGKDRGRSPLYYKYDTFENPLRSEDSVPKSPKITINQHFRSRAKSSPDKNGPNFGKKSEESSLQKTPERPRNSTPNLERPSEGGSQATGYSIYRSPKLSHLLSTPSSPNLVTPTEMVYSLPKQRLCKIVDRSKIVIFDRSGTELFSEEFCLPAVGKNSGKFDTMVRFSKFKDRVLFFVDSKTVCFLDARLDIIDPVYFKDEEYDIVDACIDEVDENIIAINEISVIFYKNYKTKFLSEDASLATRGDFRARGVSLSDSFATLMIGFEFYDDQNIKRDKIILRKKARTGYFRPYLEERVENGAGKVEILNDFLSSRDR